MTISKKILGYVMLNTCSVLTLFVVLPFWEFTKDCAQAREPVVITVTTTIQAAIDISGEGDTINVPADYASTTEAYPIDFYGHENITFDCQNSGAIIGPSSTVTGQINMTTGTTITNCFFSNVEIISYLNLNEAADLTITNNSFDSDVTNTISVGGSGTVIINNNASLNSISVSGDFSSSFITDNFLRVVYADCSHGIHIVANYENGAALISNNIIHNYRHDVRSISVEGLSDNSVVTIASNTIKYIESGYVTNFLGALGIGGTANVNYHHNYIDVSRLIINEGQIILAQQDPGYHAPDPTTIIFNHNTVVFRGSDAAGGPKGFFVEGYLNQEYTTYITSTYNLWVNVGATSTGINAFVFAINTTTYTGNLYSDYDGFWNFENIFVDEDVSGNNTSTITNSFTQYPFFKNGDSNPDNDLELAPFSNYLDVGGPEGSNADVGAYSAVRRNSIYIDSSATIEMIDYENYDITSTLYLNDAVRTGDEVLISIGNIEPFIIASSTFCTSSLSISGGNMGMGENSIIDATGYEYGISLVSINSTTIKDFEIYGASIAALKLDNSSFNQIEWGINRNSGYGVWFAENSQNNTVHVLQFYDNYYYDIYSTSNSDNIASVLYFDLASSSINGIGNVDIYERISVYAKDSDDNSVANVIIDIHDNHGGQNFTTTTRMYGGMSSMDLNQYFLAWKMTSSSPASTTEGGYNPFTVTASKSGYITTSTTKILSSDDYYFEMVMLKSTSTAPSDITTSSVNTSSIAISWTDNSDNEDGFVIEKSTTSTSGFIFTATTSVDTTSTIINTLLPNTQYWFRVAAFNLDTTSTYITTTEGTYTLAVNPSSVSAVANSATQITISWADDNSSAYYVSRAGNNSGWITSTSYIFSGLTCGTSYTFNVKAKNHDDIETGSIAVTASTGNCSSGGGGGGGAGSSVSTVVNAVDVPLVINGTQQGTLSYNVGGGDSVQVVIPANSFTGSATFRVVGSLVNTTLPAGSSIISGGVYVITATDSNNNPISNFSNNLNITFSGLELPADVSNVGVYYLNETTNEWVLISGAIINPTAGTVTFSVNHFTKFAVLNIPGTPNIVKNSVTKITAIDGTVIEGKLKIKVSGKSAIYWLDQNNNYYYYPDGDVFKSWNVDESYSYYKAVSQTSFNNLVQPSVAPYHVFYRNGSEVVKYLSSDKLYVVGLNNTLYPITNDAIVSLYGSKYKPKTIGLSEWPYYVKDASTTVSMNSVYPGMFIKISGKNYFIDSERKMREITADAMRPNHLKPVYFRSLPSSAIAGLQEGVAITDKVSELTSFIGY